MSTSLLYHGFGLRGDVHHRTRYEKGIIEFQIDQPRADWRCSASGTPSGSRGSPKTLRARNNSEVAS